MFPIAKTEMKGMVYFSYSLPDSWLLTCKVWYCKEVLRVPETHKGHVRSWSVSAIPKYGSTLKIKEAVKTPT